MQNFLRKAAYLLGFSSILGLSLPVNAIPYNANTVYRAGNDIIISGTANSQATLQFSGVTITANRTANACGLIVLRPTTSNPQFTGTITAGAKSVTVGSLPTNTIPTCNSLTGELSDPRTSDFKTEQGAIVFVGLSPGLAQPISYTGSRTRRATIGACGFATVRSTTTNPITTATSFSLNGTDYTVGSLPDAVNPPYCRRNSTTGVSVGYRPVTW